MSDQIGSRSRYTDFFEEIPAADPAAPAAPTEPATPAAPSATPPAPAEPAAPAEGPPAGEPTPPVAPAEPTPPAQPRESAMQKRARELREKSSGQNALADKLDPKPVTTTPPPPSTPTPAPATPDNRPVYLTEDDEIDPGKLDDYIDRRADQRYEARRNAETLQDRRQQFVANLETEGKALADSYPELNPTSDKYNEALDDAISGSYMNSISNSQGQVTRIDLDLKGFAEPLVKAFRAQGTQVAADTQTAVAAAGGTGALVPGTDAGKTTGKTAEEMTVQELEAELIKKHGKPLQR